MTVQRALKVLVIDDDPIVLETVRERLLRRGYHVRTHGSALGATSIVQAEQPDMVLLDVMMPVLNGEHLADLLRAEHGSHAVSIVLHSSKADAELAALVQLTGARGAIQKTGNADAFCRAFDALASEHRTQRSAEG